MSYVRFRTDTAHHTLPRRGVLPEVPARPTALDVMEGRDAAARPPRRGYAPFPAPRSSRLGGPARAVGLGPLPHASPLRIEAHPHGHQSLTRTRIRPQIPPLPNQRDPRRRRVPHLKLQAVHPLLGLDDDIGTPQRGPYPVASFRRGHLRADVGTTAWPSRTRASARPSSTGSAPATAVRPSPPRTPRASCRGGAGASSSSTRRLPSGRSSGGRADRELPRVDAERGPPLRQRARRYG